MRDDFTKKTKDLLAKRVGWRCSNPNCRRPTSAAGTKDSDVINIGVAAHITAASEKGPRYNKMLSAEERRSYKNGIWLCQSCAKLIDSDENRYSVDVLQEWKRNAEEQSVAEIEVATTKEQSKLRIVKMKSTEEKKKNLKRVVALSNSLVNSHVEHGSYHLYYYFNTSTYFQKEKEGIVKWLRDIRINNVDEDKEIYNFIVAPLHCHYTFIKEVNKLVFKEAAFVLIIDVDRESNVDVKSKYHDLLLFYENLVCHSKKSEFCFHFVDDTIITGDTFQRAQYLLRSIFPQKFNPQVSITIFKSVIVILDQSSDYYKENYVCDNFHAYVYFENYSIRTRKDTCILCKQVADSKKMINSSATNCMSRYWEEQWACHRCVSMEFLKTNPFMEKKSESEKRKMLCLHIVNEKLSSLQENDKISKVRQCILDTLLNSKWNEELFGELIGRQLNERLEWLMSYISILSFPGLLNSKVMHRVILTILVQLLNYLLEYDKRIMKDMRRKIPDLKQIFDDFDELNSDMNSKRMSFAGKYQMRYILLLFLINRLSEMNSVYIMLKENTERVLNYFGSKVNVFQSIQLEQTFELEYLVAIKQVTSHDEFMETWLEHLLLSILEYSPKSNGNFYIQKLNEFYMKMYMENTNVFRNAICNITKEVRVHIEQQMVDNERLRALIYRDISYKQLKNYCLYNLVDIITCNFRDNPFLLNGICILYKYVLYGSRVFYDVWEYYMYLAYFMMKVTNAENVLIVMSNSEGRYYVIGEAKCNYGDLDRISVITSSFFEQTFNRDINETLMRNTYYLDDSLIGILGFFYQYKNIPQHIISERMVYFYFRFPKEHENERYKYLRNVLLFRHEIDLKLEKDLSSNAFANLEL